MWEVCGPAAPASHASVLEIQTPSPLQTCQGPQLAPLHIQFERPWCQVRTQAENTSAYALPGPQLDSCVLEVEIWLYHNYHCPLNKACLGAFLPPLLKRPLRSYLPSSRKQPKVLSSGKLRVSPPTMNFFSGLSALHPNTHHVTCDTINNWVSCLASPPARKLLKAAAWSPFIFQVPRTAPGP